MVSKVLLVFLELMVLRGQRDYLVQEFKGLLVLLVRLVL